MSDTAICARCSHDRAWHGFVGQRPCVGPPCTCEGFEPAPLASTDPTPPDAPKAPREFDDEELRATAHGRTQSIVGILCDSYRAIREERNALSAARAWMESQLAVEKGVDESLRAQLADARAEIATLRQDRDRLDEIPELIRAERLVIYGNGVVGLDTRSSPTAIRRQTFATLRQAIDAARAAPPPEDA